MVDYSSEFGESFWDEEAVGDQPASLAGWWLFSLILASCLCLISESVLAGAIVPAFYTMAPSFRAAMWLRRHDPNLNRARSCSRFQLATGCWTALYSGILVTLVLVAVSVMVGHPPSESQGAAALLVVATSAVATSLIGLWAVGTAWKYRVRVWAHPKLLSLANHYFANLSTLVVPPTMSNHAVYVTAISLSLPPMVFGTGLMVAAALGRPFQPLGIVEVVSGLLLLFVGPAIAIVLVVKMSSRLFANGPADCWSAPTDDADLDE